MNPYRQDDLAIVAAPIHHRDQDWDDASFMIEAVITSPS